MLRIFNWTRPNAYEIRSANIALVIARVNANASANAKAKESK